MSELNDRLIAELVDAVRAQLKKEQGDRLRDIYLIGDIEKDTARAASSGCASWPPTSTRPITLYINSAGGNVTDGLAIHDAIRQIVSRGIEVTIIVQGMAYSMGSIVLQAASPGRRLAFPHSWIMIHEPAKWAGWQSTTAAAQHLERLKQMQDQIYKILSSRSGKPLRQIIKDTKRTDFYLDAQRALDYGLVDAIVAGELPEVGTADIKEASSPTSLASEGEPATDDRLPAAAAARETFLVAGALPLVEQPRRVAGDRSQARRPAERPRARAAHDLIERQRVGDRCPSWRALLRSARAARRARRQVAARSRRRCR